MTPHGPERIFFYPHAYLRDRQLDTIRNWPRDRVVNLQAFEDCRGQQVDRARSLSPSRGNWKGRLPLVNLKRRPAECPADAAVFAWNSLIVSGPYVVEIDNPYAFTAYNALATGLYRAVIRSFLVQPRCLTLRCLSEACLDGVRREFGEKVAGKAEVAYPKIQPRIQDARIQDMGPRSRGCRFLFVSTQFEIKGGEALIRAFRSVKEQVPDAELVLVTHLPGGLRRDVADIPGITVHDAAFTRAEIADIFLCACDVLVHPTYMDSFGMVVLEAMSCALPIIASNHYAIPEMVRHGTNGFLLDPPVSIWNGTRPTPLFSDVNKVRAAARRTDTEPFASEMAQAMVTLARDPELRRAFGRASLRRLKDRFA